MGHFLFHCYHVKPTLVLLLHLILIFLSNYWHWHMMSMLVSVASNDQKCNAACPFDHLDLLIKFSGWQIMPLTSWCWYWCPWIASCDQKGLVAYHFDHLNLTNGIMPLMMLFLALCFTDASISGLTCPKNCTLFELSWSNEYSGTIDHVIGTTWCKSHL